ncbi:40S ribosomal protein S18, partial [Mucuna pruriens]
MVVAVIYPLQFKIANWFLNRKKDYKDEKYYRVVSNALDMKLMDDSNWSKKMRIVSLKLRRFRSNPFVELPFMSNQIYKTSL